LKEIWSENRWVSDGQGEQVATAFVLRDGVGNELDAHALILDEQGNGIPQWLAEEGFILARQDLDGQGSIEAVPVHCISASMQAVCHRGYELPEAQRGDMERLRAKFGEGICDEPNE
jgi:hypothetical protein